MSKTKKPEPPPCMKCGRTDHKDKCVYAECEYRHKPRAEAFDSRGFDSLGEGCYQRHPHFE